MLPTPPPATCSETPHDSPPGLRNEDKGKAGELADLTGVPVFKFTFFSELSIPPFINKG
jgi:hypothetical protein